MSYRRSCVTGIMKITAKELQDNCYTKTKVMAKEKYDNAPENEDKNAGMQPDPETLNTTDPQEHMEGPLSSVMQSAKESFEPDETKEEADAKKDAGK